MTHLKNFFFIFTFVMCSCLGTEVGNPPEKDPGPTTPSEIKIDFVSQGARSQHTIIDLRLSSDIEIEEATIVVKDLRFRRCDLGENQALRTRSFLAELLKEDRVDTSIEMPFGEYCRIDLRPIRGGEDGAFSDRPELKGYTMYARGTYKGMPLIIRHEGDDEISFFGKFTIDSNSDRLFISVDFEKWFSHIDLSEARSDDGKIILSNGRRSSNTGLLKTLSDNFEASISIGLDLNGNGIFDPIELRGEDP